MRIELDRLGEHPLAQAAGTTLVQRVEELPAPEIVGVGLDILGRRLLDRLLLLRQQLDLELLDDRRA